LTPLKKTTKKYWFHHLSSYAFLETTSRIRHTYILFNEEIFVFSAKPARNQKNKHKSVVSISSIKIGQKKPTTLRGKNNFARKKENTQYRAK
jgi:hypothetical protein